MLEQNKNIMKLLLPFHLQKVGAGFPSPATDYIEDDIDLNTYLIKNIPSTFLIRVQGKSMNKVGIHNNDLLVVDRSLDPKNFSTVIANVNEELVVKTFIKEKNQSFLTSGSKEIKDRINLVGSPEIIIWGVVTYVVHALQ
jgi:DNA polymerase V